MDHLTAVATHADASWATGPLLGFDTETTGLDVATDRVVTAALVLRVPGVRTEVRTWLLDPGVEIPAEATGIHGITTAHAREHGRAPARALDEIATELVRHVGHGVPLVAYNAAFDLSLLDAELTRHGLPTVPERLGRPVAPVLDPLVIDRWQDAGREGKRRLGDLCALYGVVGDGDLHTADVDALATLDDEEVKERLVAIRGLGEWTADWFLARHLGRPHAWPAGDLGLRKAVAIFYGDGRDLTTAEVRALGSRFDPFQNLTAHYLLTAYLARDR